MEEPIFDERGQEVKIKPILANRDPLKNKDRSTCRLSYYHEHKGEDAVVAEVVYSAMLETLDVEPQAKRRLKAKPEWTRLPIGDMEAASVGMIIIQNVCGQNLQVLPTPEEKEEFEKQVFRIRQAGVEGGLEIIIKPGRFQAFEVNISCLEIKCDHNDGRGYIWVFPR